MIALSRRHASQIIRERSARRDFRRVIPRGPIIAAMLNTYVDPINTGGMGADVTGVGFASARNTKLRDLAPDEGETCTAHEERCVSEFTTCKYAHWLEYARELRDAIQKVEFDQALELARAIPQPSLRVYKFAYLTAHRLLKPNVADFEAGY